MNSGGKIGGNVTPWIKGGIVNDPFNPKTGCVIGTTVPAVVVGRGDTSGLDVGKSNSSSV